MNTATGQVVDANDPKWSEKIAKEPEKWREFSVGEIVELKGIKFRIRDVRNRKLILTWFDPNGA